MSDDRLLQLLAEQTIALQKLAKEIADSRLDNEIIQSNAEQRYMDLLANSLADYIHDPQSKLTFGSW